MPTGFTTQIEWRDPVFVDDDPAQPLSDDEMRAKIYQMLAQAGQQGRIVASDEVWLGEDCIYRTQ